MGELAKQGKKQEEKNKKKIADEWKQLTLVGQTTAAPPPVTIMPEVYDYEATSTRRRSGFRKTIRAGNVSPNSGKKTVLG